MQSRKRVSRDQLKLAKTRSKLQSRDQDKTHFYPPALELSDSTPVGCRAELAPTCPGDDTEDGDQYKEETTELYSKTPPSQERTYTNRDQRDEGDRSNPIVIDSDEEDQLGLSQQMMSKTCRNKPTEDIDRDFQRMELAEDNEDQWGMKPTDEDQLGIEHTEQHSTTGAASAITATTRYGGCAFEDLSRDILVNYACDHLVRIDGDTDGIDEAEKKIRKNVEECITEIELQSEKKVKKLYFGKTYIHRRKQGRGKFAKFDCMDHKTWKKTGISARWQGHKGKEYAKNGMVVLAAIHKESIPKKCREARKDVHQEDYALALEQRLIQHYLFSEGDERLENKTLTAGGSDGKMSVAYALYMTFTLEDSPPPSPY